MAGKKILRDLMLTRRWGTRGIQPPEVVRALKKENLERNDPFLAAEISGVITPEVRAGIASEAIKDHREKITQASIDARRLPDDWKAPALEMAIYLRATNPHFLSNILLSSRLAGES